MRSTRSRFHSCVEYRLTVSVGLVAAVWVAAVSRWVVSDLVVPWDSKNQFYAFFRLLSATLRAGERPLWNPYHYGGSPRRAERHPGGVMPVLLVSGLVAAGPRGGGPQFSAFHLFLV